MGALPVSCAGSVLDSLWLAGEVADHVVGDTPILNWRTDGSLVLTRMEVQVGNDSDWIMAENWATGESLSPDTFITYGGLPLTDGFNYLGRVRVGRQPVLVALAGDRVPSEQSAPNSDPRVALAHVGVQREPAHVQGGGEQRS